MKKLVATAALLSAATCTGALAQVYVGVAAGRSYTPVDCLTGYTCRNMDLGVKAYGGFALSPTVAVELGYVDFGKATGDFDFFGMHLHDEIGAKAVTAAAALRAPFGTGWSGVARFGVANVDARETHTLSAYNRQKTSLNPYLGLGLEYALVRRLKAVLMLDATTGDTGATNGGIFALTAGLQYGF